MDTTIMKGESYFNGGLLQLIGWYLIILSKY